MSNFTRVRKIVVSIATQKNVYYRSTSDRWVAGHKKAREFLAIEEAQQEADHIGAVVFLEEHCQPVAVQIEILRRNGQQKVMSNYAAPTLIQQGAAPILCWFHPLMLAISWRLYGLLGRCLRCGAESSLFRVTDPVLLAPNLGNPSLKR